MWLLIPHGQSPRASTTSVRPRAERADWIDAAAKPVHEPATRLTRASEPARDALSGTGLGHPAHPALVLGPLGCWISALAADVAGDRRAARHLTSAGVALAIPAVATGLSDWTDTTGAEQRVGFLHSQPT